MEGRLGQPHGPHQPQMYGKHHHLQTKSHHGTGGRPYPILKAATAVTAGGSLLVLSGLILAGTIIGLTIATPLIVIFSPVLAPAAIAITFLTAGFLASGGLGVAALSVSSWIYSYVTGKHPVMADTLDRAGMKMTTTAKEIKGKAEQIGHQTQ